MIPDAASRLSRSFVLAHFFPATLFTFFLLMVFHGDYSELQRRTPPLISEILSADFVTIAAAFFLFSLSVAGLLKIGNTALIKLFEGLILGPRLLILASAPARRRYKEGTAEIERLRAPTAEGLDPDQESLDDAYDLEWQLLREYPPQEAAILPTRLGNIIAAFEHYPFRRYGMDAITLWPRLCLVLDKERLEGIAGAKNSVDCVLNISFLAGVYAVWSVTFTKCGFWSHAQILLAALLISLLSYRMSLELATWWGDLVRAAFDVCRLNLLRRLGVVVEHAIITSDQEHQVWRQVQWAMKYDYLPEGIGVQLSTEVNSPMTPPYGSSSTASRPLQSRYPDSTGVSASWILKMGRFWCRLLRNRMNR